MFQRRVSLVDCLHYEDLIEFDPNSYQQIEVRGEEESEKEDMDSAGWQKQSYIIRCVIIPARYMNIALEKLAEWDIKLSSYWENDRKFNFGEEAKIKGIPINQFIFERKHPITNKAIIELRHDFVRYHALDIRNENEYFHPLENLVVARIEYSSDKPEKIRKVIIHRDFLKDFLSARKSGLLLGLVMDRFCNIRNPEALGINEEQRHMLKPGIYREINIRPVKEARLFRVRSILWKTDIIKPYRRPKSERNFWYLPSSKPIRTTAKFFINSEGKKLRLTDYGVPPYLYFQRAVLERYIKSPGYDVFFHMRKWGCTSNPFHQGIDVGINSEGLANAFAADISKLPPNEQAYWSSYSTIPVGEVCEELFQTRMQLQPPHSPGVFELFSKAKKRIDEIFRSLVGENLYKKKEPEKKELHHLTVGPLRDDFIELVSLAKILYLWIVEGMQLKVMKKAVDNALKNEHNARQIRHLEELLHKKANLSHENAKKILFPLRGLNKLRQMDAHLRSLNEIKIALNQIGISQILPQKWKVWDLIVDNLISCMNKIIELLEAES